MNYQRTTIIDNATDYVEKKVSLPTIIALLMITSAIVFISVGCTPESLAEEELVLEVIIQDTNPSKEEIQAFKIYNCGGKADITRVEERSLSVDTTISAELAATLGASVEVISAETHGAVSAAKTSGSKRSTSIGLNAPPDTWMEFELVWSGTEDIGIVRHLKGFDIPIAFRSFTPMDVYIRSQSDVGCPANSSVPIPMLPSTQHSVCAFLTKTQLDLLRQIQDAREAIERAEKYAGYRQNDYKVGDIIPANVVIATNIHRTDLKSIGVTPLNSSDGYGLFITNQEFVASHPGTYWCIESATTMLRAAEKLTPFPDELNTPKPIIVNGESYPRPDPSIEPFCVATEVNTQGKNRVKYDIVIPSGWVMVWSSRKASWPGDSYGENGLLAIYGEWSGQIEIDTGGSCSAPVEWADFAIQNRRDDYPINFRPEFSIGANS